MNTFIHHELNVTVHYFKLVQHFSLISFSNSRYQSGDQTPASESGGPTGGQMAPPGDLDVKTQILQQQELQKQAAASAKVKGSSAPTSPMKDNKKASFFGKVYEIYLVIMRGAFNYMWIDTLTRPSVIFLFRVKGLDIFTSCVSQSGTSERCNRKY